MLFSCSAENSDDEINEWNVWIYLDGDNDLSKSIESDFREIINYSLSDKINICVQIDLVGTTTQRFHVSNGQSELIADLGEVDMTQATTITDFLQWANTQGKAERNLLIFSDHGNGWDQLSGSSPAAKVSNRAMFSDVDNAKPQPQVYLHNHLLADAIRAANVSLDILGFDASLMGNIETLYEFAELAPILIASEEVGNAEGWNYQGILTAVSQQNDMSSEILADVIVEHYQQLMQNLYVEESTPVSLQYHSIAAYRSETIVELANEINRVSNKLLTGLEESTAETLHKITVARQNTQFIDQSVQIGVYVDVKSLLASFEVESNITSIYEQMLINEYHGSARPEASGLSIVFYAPKVGDDINNAWDWNTIDSNYKNWNPENSTGNKGRFINEFKWDEFLAAYYAKLGLTL